MNKEAPYLSLKHVPYVPEDRIQNFTWKILNQMYPDGVPLPIPVEEIAEYHYKLSLEFDELKAEILGYSDFAARKIWINSLMLDQCDEGRIRFTIAHELGHYSYHLYYMQGEGMLFSTSLEFYQKNYSRIETQANIFAGCLLMPKPLVLTQWVEVTGSEAPYSLEEERRRNERREEEWRQNEKNRGFLFLGNDDSGYRYTREMADSFGVSFQCAKIQLKKLGLLY
jgi:Zn-dependent peptidase ImmA (M78 family)